MDGKENAYQLHDELGRTMLVDCTIERDNATLDRVLSKIDELTERAAKVGVTDTSGRANQGGQFVRHLNNMLVIARVIAQGARNRDESRGAHFKPAFKDRNDKDWLRTTLSFHGDVTNGAAPQVRYVRSFEYTVCGKPMHATDDVDVSLVRPRPRKYEQAGAASAAAKGEARPSQAPRPSAAAVRGNAE
jgi:succinate dehydrogenase / fumarate reductase flavoprotein subunit